MITHVKDEDEVSGWSVVIRSPVYAKNYSTGSEDTHKIYFVNLIKF